MAAAGVAGLVALGCTSAGGTDVASLGELEPDTCLPFDPPDPADAVAGVTTDDEEIVAEVADQVAAIRELAWDEIPTPTLLPRERLAEVVATFLPNDLLDVERRLLVAIGAVPPDLDLAAQLLAFETDLAGFYVVEAAQLLVAQETPGELRVAERWTLAHELVHALTDEALGFPLDAFGGDVDRDLAARSVVEGDATVVESFWTSLHLTPDDRAARPIVYVGVGGDLDLPHVVRRRGAFPYVEGRAFVCQVYLDGGWRAVDALYTDVPTTTAEILTGTRVDPTSPPAVATPGDDWLEIGRSTVGAAELQWFFEAPGDDTGAALDDPLGRALAWRGGEVTVWTDTATGTRDLVALALVDGGGGPARLCDSVDAWQSAAFPDADRSEAVDHVVFDRGEVRAVLVCDDDEVVLTIGDDPDLVGDLAGSR